MKELAEYLKIMDKRFDEPPRNTPEVLRQTLSKYPAEFVFEYEGDKMVAGLTLVILGMRVYTIHYMATIESGKGYGSRLLKKLFSNHKGVFIARTDTPRFYTKNGFTAIGELVFYVNGVIKR